MNAKLIVDRTHTHEEWLEARRAGVSASEVAALMGLSPYESPLSLYHRKVGDLGEQPDTDAMSLGRYLESWVAGWFADRHPELHMEPGGLFASVDRPWQMATPDRLLYDDVCRCDAATDPEIVCTCLPAFEEPVSALECKTDASYDGWGDDGSDDIPAHYRAQTLWQMDVLDLPEVRVACLFLHSRQVREYIIARDDQAERDLELMRHEAETFLHRVDQGEPPPVDSHPATSDTLKALHQDLEDREVMVTAGFARRYASAVRRLREAEARKNGYDNKLRDKLGNARVAINPDGGKVATRSVFPRTSLDTKRLRAEQPNIYQQYATSTTVNRLNPAKENK